MAVVELDHLSMPDAEEAIAEVWSCLEEYGIPSPMMSVQFHPNARVTMEFKFDEPVGAHLVRLRLSSWAPASLDASIASASGHRLLAEEETTTLFTPHIAAAFSLSAATPAVLAEPFRRAKRR